MARIKDSNASTAARHAARAAQEGRTVLLYRQNVGAASSGFSGPVGDAGEVIEAIESQGWELAQMAYDKRQSRNGGLMLLFRAAPAAVDGYDPYYQDVPSDSYQDVPSGRHSHRRG